MTKLDWMYLISNRRSERMILVLDELQVEQPPYSKAGEPQESRLELPLCVNHAL
jgi:hypothetical protein